MASAAAAMNGASPGAGRKRGFADVSSSPDPKLRLTYLDIKGIAEPVRLALFIGGIPFEDRRVTYEQLAELRRLGQLPCGQVPVLEIDGEGFAQSMALLRWAGRRAGLYPEDLSQLRCDMVEEALADIRRVLWPQWYGVVLGRHPRTGEKLVPLTETQKQEVQGALNDAVLPARFEQLERLLEASGGPYFCGERLTTCDLSFYVIACGFLDGSYCEGVKPTIFDGCPKLLALRGRIAEHPKVKEWDASH